MTNLDTRSPTQQRTDPLKKFVWVNSLSLHRTPFQVLESLVRRCGYEQGLHRYQIQVSRAQLERDLHMSRTAVADCLRYLESRELILTIHRTDSGKRYDKNLYVIGVGLALPHPVSREDYSQWIAQGRPWKVRRSNLDQPTPPMRTEEPEIDGPNLDQPNGLERRTSTNELPNLDQHSIGSQSEFNELLPGEEVGSSALRADVYAREHLTDVAPSLVSSWVEAEEGRLVLSEPYRSHEALPVWTHAVSTYTGSLGWAPYTVASVARALMTQLGDFEAVANRMLADAIHEKSMSAPPRKAS